MADAQAKFLTGNLFKHVTVMSLTASIGLVAIFLVDLIDMVFISMLGRDELAAAVGYAGAILFFTTAFSIGMAISAGALVARALGEGDAHKARRRAATSTIYGFGIASVFSAIVWLNLEPLARAVGASGPTLELSVQYMQIIVPSLPILMLGMVGGAILRAHGDARRAMMATLGGSIVNAVLDPILIFGLDLELTGAALASVAARCTIGFMSLYPVFKHYGGFDKPTREEMRVDLPAIAAIAAPAILTQFATPFGQAYITRAMSEFGEEAVAGMAIVGRLIPVAFGAILALSGAVGPIIGQNFGAGQHERVRGAFRDAMIFTALWVLGASILLFLLRDPLVWLFNAEGMAVTLLFLFCGPLALTYIFDGLIFVGNASFNNLGHPFYSTWINWGRHTLGTLPFVAIGASLWGAPGILIGRAAGGAVFALVALYLAMRVMRVKKSSDSTAFAREGRQMSLWHLRR